MAKQEKETVVNEYVPMTQNECAQEAGFNWMVDEFDVALDLKYILKDAYIATFILDGKSLQLKFTNGQKFVISVSEVTA